MLVAHKNYAFGFIAAALIVAEPTAAQPLQCQMTPIPENAGLSFVIASKGDWEKGAQGLRSHAPYSPAVDRQSWRSASLFAEAKNVQACMRTEKCW